MHIGLRVVILAAAISIAAGVVGAFANDRSRRMIPPSIAATAALPPGRTSDPPPRPVPTRDPVVAPQPTALLVRATATALAPWSGTLSGDSYRRVRDHPDLTAGDNVAWTCAIARGLGRDGRTGQRLMACDLLAGAGRIVLRFPRDDHTSNTLLAHGAVLIVWGTVLAPYRGTGVRTVTPQLLVYFLAPASYAAPVPR